jgi:hypothetical protein
MPVEQRVLFYGTETIDEARLRYKEKCEIVLNIYALIFPKYQALIYEVSKQNTKHRTMYSQS